MPDVGAVLDRYGYVQIDPINVCGRMQDLILRNRVENYRPGGLMRHLHGDGATLSAHERTAFEHHLPGSSVLVAMPHDAWPHLLEAMRERTLHDGAWSGRLSADERKLAKRILAEIASRGPLTSSQIEDAGPSRPSGWGSATLAKSTLQKLYFHGRVLIARREGTRRFYDLPERVLPPATLAASLPSPEETARWLALTKLRQRRLTPLKRNELSHTRDEVLTVRISDADAPLLHILREDLPLLEASREAPENGAPFPPLLLAPLDPLIYDRRTTLALWDFDYTWEVYTPPAKRVRGYYALPVLSGHEIVGHVDPKADVKAGNLNVISRRVRRGHAVAPAVKSLARFLGLR
ncbi:winged helix DNA-binding domain-containing protein [Luteolibacter sp. SL250]|uniref:DNA glycosylase AlkZ-like family protein n=1 Tax=Luteolibacter sp. SL250 TaxID=2995170 RepID=UPI00226F2BFD|nr:crosslink repair DNA glycosylase YcaQ family protein [Luteolibacter sp. SL250]WAC19310.1 winged helix DNA-binding domain-containing protein [Luteolibacter sp. SL250]